MSQLCDACYTTHLLGHWVRERGAMSLERAVHMLTGRTAALFICPSTNGMASRATNTKMRNTIKIAVSEMRKIPCSASHSAGRARWPR